MHTLNPVQISGQPCQIHSANSFKQAGEPLVKKCFDQIKIDL